tara:strand:+ start:84 stop:257 length:174 start_codon:yes stop_codon:yes gene_type:complete
MEYILAGLVLCIWACVAVALLGEKVTSNGVDRAFTVAHTWTSTAIFIKLFYDFGGLL